jgi:NADPH:quinone reductase-like Zn-dependent oxidoreductase
MTRIYSIGVDEIASESERVGGDFNKVDVANVIKLDELKLRDVGSKDVRLRILAVSAEHNISHAALADTVNIADARGGKIFPGNSAVGEVVEVGPDVEHTSVGDICLLHCNGDPDRFGYPIYIWAYDMPESIGWYGEEAVVEEWQCVPAPLDCGLNLWEIAALPLRAPTAYHLWRRAEGIYRLKVSEEKQAVLNVLGFGGGVSELFLMLAKHQGHNTFFCSGSPERRKALENLGIHGIDQKAFNRFAGRDDVKAFIKECRTLTGGEGMHIVCDMLRGPVFGAGIAVQARQGVNVSAGWQLSRDCNYNSAGASLKQITLDHTHYDTVDGVGAATELYGKVFKPTIHDEIFSFEDLPRAMRDQQFNTLNGIGIIRVAEDMPEAVQGLIP